MLRIHKEGVMMLLGMAVIETVICGLIFWLAPSVFPYLAIVLIALFIGVLQFFRNPKRPVEVFDDNVVYAPADGKVVVIEETVETEYFKDKRIQVSIFMSPTNVHVNRNPIGGIVKFFRYHEGKYLVAWHPKASTENERTTVVIDNGKSQVLFRQVAGALAKRIIAYVKEGDAVTQGADMGFIKFGSRVDLYLPLDAKIDVKIDDQVKGNRTVVARLK
jgi:phosphatidylserine decarboxylase